MFSAIVICAETFDTLICGFSVKICTFNYANGHRGGSLNSEAIDDVSVTI
jgi:hypothetical protein